MGLDDCCASSRRIDFAIAFDGPKSRVKECRSNTRLGSDSAAPVLASKNMIAPRNARDIIILAHRFGRSARVLLRRHRENSTRFDDSPTENMPQHWAHTAFAWQRSVRFSVLP